MNPELTCVLVRPSGAAVLQHTGVPTVTHTRSVSEHDQKVPSFPHCQDFFLKVGDFETNSTELSEFQIQQRETSIRPFQIEGLFS